MSFKCSVFGHRYGDPDVEREREEQGSEVVITIKEMETCKRCGETRIVSENKEVTTLETPSDIVGEDIADEETDGQTETPEEPEPATPGADIPVGETTTDDAEFIDDGDEETDAATVEHGESPDLAAGDGLASGDVPADVDSPDAEEDDAVILDEAKAETDEDRAPGQWPDDVEEEADEDEEWTPSTDQELRPVEDEQPDVEPTSDAVTVPEGKFYCPECGFTTDVEASSLREGDFCPECHRGSLTHEPDEA